MANWGFVRRRERPNYDSISTEEIDSEFVQVPKDMKRHVIGRGGYMLNEIMEKSGAYVFTESKEEEGFTVCGNEEQRTFAKNLILRKVAKGRRLAAENQLKRTVHYIHGWNLPKDYKLKVEHVQHENRTLLPESHMQYQLIPAKQCEPQESDSSGYGSEYVPKLMENVLESLREIKEGSEFVKADMGCCFGTAVVRIPKEENVSEGDWTVDEVTEKLQSSDERSNWKMTVRGVADLNERIFKENNYKEANENVPFKASYDLTYRTPCGRELRCKVRVDWRLEDIQIPYCEVKNVLDEVHFQDEATRSRCRGWLNVRPRRYLEADILLPGCKYDCAKLTIRGRTDLVTDRDLARAYEPDEQVRNVLLTYLSQMTMCDEDGFGIRLPENLPEGFHLTLKRLFKTTLFTTDSGFAVILSKKHIWRYVMGKEECRESTDLYLHCEEWDRLLNSEVWEPEAIVRKIPEFLTFVREIQGLVVSEMHGNGSTGTNL